LKIPKEEIEKIKEKEHKKNVEMTMELLVDGVPVLREE
jgi:hypothetical protein